MKKYLFLITLFLTVLVASGATWYVVPNGAGSKTGTSWANAYSDVQSAIDKASSAGGGEVWIAKGTYKHGSAMTMKNRVAIYGGFAGTETSKEERVSGNNTIFDGEGKYRVFYNYYTSSNPLTNSAKLDNVTIQNASGSGIYNYYASPEITNCTFANNSYSFGGGMYNNSSNPTLTNCTFSGNSATNGGGMYNWSSNPTLTNCTFSNNSASDFGGGMYNNVDSDPELTNCILWGNTASNSGNEIYNLYSYNSYNKPTINTCIIKGGYSSSYGTYTNIITEDPKLMPLGNYGGSVQTCPVGAGSSAIEASKVVEGLTTDARGFTRLSTPTIGACEFVFSDCNGFYITTSEGITKYSSDCEFTLNVNISNCDLSKVTYQWYKDGKPIKGEKYPSYKTKQNATSVYSVKISDGSHSIMSEIKIETIDVIYVSTNGSASNDGLSWATAKNDVQDAIDLASQVYGGAEVWIAKGTYTHGSAMTMKNGVAIYGSFAGTETSKEERVSGNNTILDGEGKYRVFYNDYTEENPLTNSAKLDNVTIQNGYASDGDDNSHSNADYGAGMYNNYASPEITNCTFSGNSASYGGGMYNYVYSSPVLTNCTFSNNSAEYDGGGMYNRSSSSPVLTNCTFSGNSASYDGGGMYNWVSSSPKLANCTFSGNSAASNGGGMFNYYYSSPTLTNCTFSGNSASNGGGMFNYYYLSSTLTNCTFSNNSAEYDGGGMFNYDSSPVLTNCILWENTASNSGNEIYNYIYKYNYSEPTIDTCIIKGGVNGIYGNEYGTYTNIITADPKLMPLGNYGGSVQTCPVASGSSAIGAGKKISGLTTDARGVVRSTTAPTIGAYEFKLKDIASDIKITTANGYTKYSSDYKFTLNVNISNTRYVTIQWYKDEVALKGATSSSYTTSQSAGTSIYKVVISYDSQTESKSILIKTVDTPRYYVSTTGRSSNDGLSWATAKSDVQDAIDLASEYYGSEVWIAKGTYKHGSSMTMKNNVAIFGGFAGTETSKEERTSGNFVYLDGEGKYSVFYNDYTEENPLTNSAKLDNVTIQNGYASNDGAGMYNIYASPEITNCTFSGNSAGWYGGGMRNSHSSPVLTNCTFSGNSADYGGGMYNDNNSSPTLTNCTFSNNNASYRGGGMRNNGYDCSPVLTNCTFSGNSASDGGGMYNAWNSSPTLTNCILWGNTASSSGNEIYNNGSNNKQTIDTCIIQGGVNGIYDNEYGAYTNIITADPKLMPLGNYGGSVQTCPVASGSSAIGAGKRISGLTTDARGFARSATAPTIGACELANKPTGIYISTAEGYTKFSSNYEFTLNVNVVDVYDVKSYTYQWYVNDIAIEGATSYLYKTKQAAGTSKYTVKISDGTTSITSSEIVIETILTNRFYVSNEGSDLNDGFSWNRSLNNVQKAINYAYNIGGGEVWIKAGTYTTSIEMKDNVAIYGGFIGTEQSIDQRRSGNYTIIQSTSGNVIYNIGTSDSAKLDSIMISGGEYGIFNSSASPTISNCTIIDSSDDGIYNENLSFPTIINCTILDCGDCGVESDNSSPILINCTITKNHYDVYGGNPTLINSIVYDNFVPFLDGSYTNCIISENRDGANIVADPMLNVLDDNGGFVKTISVREGSPAIENGLGHESDSRVPTTDARGIVRSTIAPTIGAYEYDNIVLPAIASQPSSLEMYQGETNRLEVIVNGEYLTYQWYFNDEAIEGATESTLSFENIQTDKAGSYYCVITNPAGSVRSNTVNVLVKPAPSITTQPESLDIFANADGSLSVSATGEELTYQWYFNGDAIEGATSSSLTFENIQSTNAGSYYCVITNPAGSVQTNTVNVVVKSAPSITTQPSNLELYENGSGSLSVSASGGGLSYQWYKDGNAISGATSATLTLSNIQSDKVGSYYCVITNPAGSVQTNTVVVTVKIAFTGIAYVVPNGAGNKDGTSWANAYSDVQSAIDSAYNAGGGEVWIAKGTYKHGSAMTMKNNVAIYGGFAGTETSKGQRVAGQNRTILDGEGKYRVFYNSNITNSAKLDNVTIQNGYDSNSGAGMYNDYASPEITNCTFSGNSASYRGGGMYNNSSSRPTLTNCTFSNNSATGDFSDGGGMYNISSSPVLTNCTFSNNSATGNFSDGGGMYNAGSSPKLTNCILWGNTATSSGNEICNDDSNNNPTIDTCIIKGGYSSYGTYTNIITADPKLMSLGNYGGSVQTCPVGAESSAIGAGKVVDDVTTDARGVVRSTTAPTIGAYEYIEVIVQPTITTQPSNLELYENGSGSLSVSATGEELTYQWYFNSEAIEGATESTLSFENIQSTNAGSYYCIITNPAGSVQTNTVQVTVKVTFTGIAYVVPNGAGNKDGTSWANAYSDVQSAIDKASSAGGGEVWIAKGTYKHGSAMTMKNGVAIYGGFAGTETSKDQRVAGNNTILDGEGKYRVFYNNYSSSNKLTNSAKLDNVTIQNGYVDSNNGYDGGGMYNNYASPEITNCTFTNNSATRDGGAIRNINNSKLKLRACSFFGNNSQNGGAISNDASDIELVNSTFVNNRTSCDGGGMYNWNASPILVNCTFTDNVAEGSGGAVNNEITANPKFNNCILWGNTANYGNEICNKYSNCNPTIDSCIIKGGYSSYGTYTNIITADPKLLPLGDYGGSVQTCPVGAGSSAIGAGKVVEGVPTDARGVVRSTTAPTIGAYEYVAIAEVSAFESWANGAGLTGDNAKPTAIPHNDGITNLEKFTFGLDASKATSYDANVNFKHTSDATGVSLQFPVSVDAEGIVQVKALKSVDLINWTETTVTATGETSADGKFKIYKATAPVGEDGKVFLKLQVEEK